MSAAAAAAAAAATTPGVVNPYAKVAQNDENMGRQSQQSVSNQTKRKFKLAQPSRRRKRDQLTLDNQLAFQSDRDCIVCKAKSIKKFLPSYSIPKRAHNVLCGLNTKTKGLGELTTQTVANLEDNKRCKVITAPIRPEERFSGKHNSKAAAASFFAARVTTTTITKTMTEVLSVEKPTGIVTPLSLSEAAGKLVSNVEFQERHKSKGAPLAMLAFATEVSKKKNRNRDKEVMY